MILRAFVLLLFVMLIGGLLLIGARAHDHWIMKGGHRNAAGEYCCGENDCVEQHGVHTVSLPAPGFRLPSGEFIPQTETKISEDGKYWRCHRPDGSRRCFFAPMPST